MDVEKLARKALTVLKLRYGLPKSGFIAGGALANTIWELVSGNKSVVNDIDVFIQEKGNWKSTDIIDSKKGFVYDEQKIDAFMWYQQLCFETSTNRVYRIEEVTTEGIFNNIKYKATVDTPEIILESFDINCTRVGYSIEEDKFFYKDDFISFLNTGELRIVSLNSPSHTAIRLVKKKYELGATLPDEELEIIKFMLDKKSYLYDKVKLRFKNRYLEMFMKYFSDLSPHFMVSNDFSLECFIDPDFKEEDRKLWYLVPREKSCIKIKDSELSKFKLSKKLLFYIRTIANNPDKIELWDHLGHFYEDDLYYDCYVDNKIIQWFGDLTKRYPKMIMNLKGLKLSEQLKLIKKILSKVPHIFDYETAISILECAKINPDIELSEDECLLLELSVRTKVDDNREHNAEIINKFI